MAVTQYIGARYVPLFADPIDWDSTKHYEPLTIVYHQGNSFTSKQFVPTGIDITNTDYWALTGNYNAQVEQYRREVQPFDGRITANAQAIADEVTARMAEDTAIRGLITDLRGDLKDEVSAREGADTQIRTEIDNIAASIPAGILNNIVENASYLDGQDISDILSSAKDNIAFPAGVYVVSDSVICNASMYFADGAKLNITGDITINGNIIAGRYQIFQTKLNNVHITKSNVFPEWFGANADAQTDSAPAINLAIKAVRDNGAIYMSSSRTVPYVINDTIIVDKPISIFGLGQTWIRSNVIQAIRVGTMNATRIENISINNLYFINTTRNNDATDWNNYQAAFIGIEQCRFDNLRFLGSLNVIYAGYAIGNTFTNIEITTDIDYVAGTRAICFDGDMDQIVSNILYNIHTDDRSQYGFYFTATTGGLSDVYCDSCEFANKNAVYIDGGNTPRPSYNIHFTKLVCDQSQGTFITAKNIPQGYITFDDCYFEANTSGSGWNNNEPLVDLDGSQMLGGAPQSNMTFNNCFFSGIAANISTPNTQLSLKHSYYIFNNCRFDNARNLITENYEDFGFVIMSNCIMTCNIGYLNFDHFIKCHTHFTMSNCIIYNIPGNSVCETLVVADGVRSYVNFVAVSTFFNTAVSSADPSNTIIVTSEKNTANHIPDISNAS